MKPILFLIMIFLSANIFSQDISIPDLDFKNALITTLCVDLDGDGEGDIDADTNDDLEIQVSEALAIQRLDIHSQGISDLTGLEAFENLVWLDCQSNDFVEITIMNKLFLEELHFVNSNKQIEKIVITGNPKLTTLTLKGVSWPYTDLENLTYLDCSNNSLTSFNLDASVFGPSPSVQKVDCSDNEITSINIDSRFKIDSVNCSNNLINTITSFNETDASYIDISNNSISVFSITNTKLKVLNYDNNPLTNVTIPYFDSTLIISDLPLLESLIFTESASDHLAGIPLSLLIMDLPLLESLKFGSSGVGVPQFEDNSVSLALRNLPLLDFLYLLAGANPHEIYLDNLPLIEGTIQAKNSYVDLQNMSQIEIHISADIVRLSNSDNLIRGRTSIGCNKLYIHDLDQIAFLDLNIIGSDNDVLADSLYLANMPNLDSLIIGGDDETNVHLHIQDFPKLSYLSLEDLVELKSLQLADLPELNVFKAIAKIQQLNLRDLPQVQRLDLTMYLLEDLSIENMDQLKYLNLTSRVLNELYLNDLDNLISFDFEKTGGVPENTDIFSFTSLAKLETIKLNKPVVDSIVLHDLPALRSFICESGGSSTTYQSDVNYLFDDLPLLDTIVLSEMKVSSLGLIDLPSFKTFIYNENRGLEELYLNDLSLESIKMKGYGSSPNTLVISDLPNIKVLDLIFTSDKKVVFENINSLEKLSLVGTIWNDTIDKSLSFVDYPELHSITIDYNLDSIYLENIPNLNYLDLSGNSFKQLSVKNFPKLDKFLCRLNDTNGAWEQDPFDVKFDNVENITYIDFFRSKDIEQMDLSGIPKLKYLDLTLNGASNETIDYLNLKNGNPYLEVFNNNKEIKYICVDNALEYDSLLILSPQIGNPAFSDYCSFVPGGNFSTIYGNVFYENGTGTCDVPLTSENETSFTLNSSLGNITKFIKSDGSYSVESANIGSSLSLMPKWENDIYNFEPLIYDFNFDSLNQEINMDFCLSPIGEFSDLEIVLVPVVNARPGFETVYKLQYSNKGSTVLSGEILLEFDDNIMDFIDASAIPAIQQSSQLQWGFTNLSPFERREITFTMELNSPMDSPPLNGGDVLNFTASISSDQEDLKPEDNEFKLHQIVVNSFDPNDKTCLEGDLILITQEEFYVHYLIRFENTGTADAIDVVVKDKIDTTVFDTQSLVPLEASHSYTTQIRFENEVEFIFENINLPFDDQNNDGYVNFKIKLKEGLEAGDELLNQAQIFFDFNFPILTNTAESVVGIDMDGDGFSTDLDCDDNNSEINPDAEEIPDNGIDEDCDGEDLVTSIYELANSTIRIYPNPTIDLLNIDISGDLNYGASIYNLEGKLIIATNNERVINLSLFPRGVYSLEIKDHKTGQKIIKKIVKGN
jgi:hypothetical protein